MMADIDAITGAIETAARADDKDAVLTLSGHLDGLIDDKQREILRTKNTAFGAYLRDQARQPIIAGGIGVTEGESEEDRSRRLYGGLGEYEEEPSWVPRARSMLAGQTAEFGDEIVAIGAAMANILTEKDPGKSYAELYSMYLDRERDRANKFMREHPGEDISFKIGGAIASPLWSILGRLGVRAVAPLGRVGRAMRVTSPASALGAAREGLKVGAYGGAVTGFGMGEGDVLDRAGAAAEMSAYGGAGGAVLGPAVKAAVSAVRSGLTWNQARKAGMSREVFDEASAIAAMDEAVAGSGAARIARMGDDAMLADSGLAATTRLDEIIQTGGPGAAQARQAVMERGERVGAELAKELDAVLGPLQGVQTRHQLRHGRHDPSKLYEAAYATPIDYTGNSGLYLLGLLQRLPKAAFDAANKLIHTDRRMVGRRVGQIEATVAEDGTVAFERLPDLRQVDYVTRVLSDLPGMTVPVEGSLVPKVTQLGRNIFDLSREIRTILRNQIPAYDNALKLAAMNMDASAATRIGAEMLSRRTTRQDFFSLIEDLGQRELDFVKSGLRQHIDDVMARVTRAQSDPLTDENAMKEIIRVVRDLSSRDSRDKMQNLLGYEAQQIISRLSKVEQAIQVQSELVTGARTYARFAARERGDIYDQGAIRTLLSGDVAKGIGRMAAPIFAADPVARLAARQASDANLAAILTRRISQPPSASAAQAARLPQQHARVARGVARAQEVFGPLRVRAGAGAAEMRAAEKEKQRRRIAAVLRN